ncbi:MAG: universal stress protein [Bacteroidota bacterium]|jgi:nucleotide-binding universal stress UspA family protein
MYKKIICPTDFSDAADNAIDYAAKLAQIFWVELLLLNIQKISPVLFSATYDINPGSYSEERIKSAAAALRGISDHVNKAFHITSTYEVEISSKTLARAVAGEGEDSVLFVIGTNGADNIYQRIFGSHAFRIVKQTKLPVLIIPENQDYKTIARVLFIVTKHDEKNLPLDQLENFLEKFDAKITFLITGNIKTYEYCREQVDKFYKEKLNNHEFWNKNNQDTIAVLNEIKETSSFDLMVIQEHEKSLMQELISEDPLKKISAYPKIPILVLHS